MAEAPPNGSMQATDLRTIQERMRRLRAWTSSEAFVRHAKPRDRDDAHFELRELRAALAYHKFLELRDLDSDRLTRDAMEWCKADADETRMELVETLSRSAPPHPGESADDYGQRLFAIIDELRWEPRQ